jgi:hypothetical protein
MFAMTAAYAREVIHAFNAQGFAALDPKWSGGRPAKFGPRPARRSPGSPRPHPSSSTYRSPPGRCPSSSSISGATSGSP